MLKKTLSLALAALLLFVFASCAKKELTPYEQYENFVQKLSFDEAGETEFDADIFTNVKMTMDGEILSKQTMNGNMKCKIVDGKEQLVLTMDMGEFGSMEMYSDGETFVMKMNGEEIPIDADEFNEQAEDSMTFPDFTEDAIISNETEKVGSNTKHTFVLDGTKIEEFATDIYAALGMVDEDASSMSIGDVTLYCIIDKNDNPVEFYIEMQMSMTVMGIDISVDLNMKYVFNKFGSGVEINLPV